MPGCYDPTGSQVSGGEQPGTRKLHDWLLDRFGGRSLGIYNPASRAGGGLSLHAEGRAMDHGVTVDADGALIGWAVFGWCVENADAIGLQEIQFSRRIWTARRAGEGVRVDTSPAAGLHFDHVHIGQCWAGARGRTSWYGSPPTAKPPSPGVLDMAYRSSIRRPVSDKRPGRYLAAWAISARAVGASGRIVTPGTNTDVAVWDDANKRHVIFWPAERADIVGVERVDGKRFVVLAADGGDFEYELSV